MPENYYDILWIPKNAWEEEIKKAYRKLAMQHHPDRTWWDKESEKKFKKINEAYSVLWDTKKRANYDKFGNADGFSGFSWWNSGWWFNWFDVNFDFGDIFEGFESFFWWSRRWWSARKDIKWEDIEIRINLDLKDSFITSKRKIRFKKKMLCDECNWTWAKKWTSPKTCTTCNWNGYVKRRSQTIFGLMEQNSICSDCSWTWNIITEKCIKCVWQKRIIVETEKEIEIPAWIDNWMTLKFRWEWSEWVSHINWDLYITFSIKNTYEWLIRKDYDLYYNLEIDPVEAILWTKKKMKLPILWDRIIEISPWTQYDKVIKFRNDWVPNIWRDTKWDLFITLKIKIPTTLTKKERELYEQIAKERNIEHADHRWIFDKIFGD